MDYTVEISQSGRGGTIHYLENGARLGFDWEFTMDGAYIFAPEPEQWDAYWSGKAECARGRRQEILERVADEVRRQKATSARISIEDAWIHLKF